MIRDRDKSPGTIGTEVKVKTIYHIEDNAVLPELRMKSRK
jgi:hypothetical protein